MTNITSQNINDNVNCNDKIEKIRNPEVSIEDLPDDILNKLIYHTHETLEEKIENIPSIRGLNEVIKLIHERIYKKKEQLGIEIRKGNIYEIEWIGGKTQNKSKSLYLINSIFVSNKADSINISKVEPDPYHQRIFGNYKIVENSKHIGCCNIVSYRLIHEPKSVEWNKEPRQLIATTDITGVYGWEHQDTFHYRYFDIQSIRNIIHTDTQRELANSYAIVELYKVNKHYIIIAIPDNPLDTAPNRSITTYKVAKKSCYKLIHRPPHIRPIDIY